ncbi:MAG: hypothetical protein QW795_06570 [Candidatus Bathyarchaeia archaeon]
MKRSKKNEIRRELCWDLVENGISYCFVKIVDVNKMIVDVIVNEFVYYDNDCLVEYERNGPMVRFIINDLDEFEKKYIDKFLEKVRNKMSKTRYFRDAEIFEAKFKEYDGFEKFIMYVGDDERIIVRGLLYLKIRLSKDVLDKIKLMLVK